MEKKAYIRLSDSGDIIGVRSTPYEGVFQGRVVEADGYLQTFDKDEKCILTVHYGDKAKTWKLDAVITGFETEGK